MMKNFDEIKQQWAKRELPQPPRHASLKIVERSAQIRRKQRITQVILGLTVLLLLLFFFYISAYKNTQTFWGLGLMIGSLLLRILMEYFSELRKEKFPTDDTMTDFNNKLETYYKMRKYIHFIVTPLLFGTYIVGFLMLLPSFSENLSPGFYTYILYSSVVVFVILAILIIVQIRKELYILKDIRK